MQNKMKKKFKMSIQQKMKQNFFSIAQWQSFFVLVAGQNPGIQTKDFLTTF